MTNKRVYEKGSNDSKQNTRVKVAVKNGFLQLLFFLFSMPIVLPPLGS